MTIIIGANCNVKFPNFKLFNVSNFIIGIQEQFFMFFNSIYDKYNLKTVKNCLLLLIIIWALNLLLKYGIIIIIYVIIKIIVKIIVWDHVDHVVIIDTISKLNSISIDLWIHTICKLFFMREFSPVVHQLCI